MSRDFVVGNIVCRRYLRVCDRCSKGFYGGKKGRVCPDCLRVKNVLGCRVPPFRLDAKNVVRNGFKLGSRQGVCTLRKLRKEKLWF